MTGLQQTRLSDEIAVIRLDRPEKRNALDSATLDELVAALGVLAADTKLRVLIFSTTSTKALCAGADVSEQLDNDGAVARMLGFTRAYQAVVDFPLPVIAVCVGDVVGGGAELAAACDLRVGGENLKMAWVGAKLGVPVGPARLVPIVGMAKAKELIYTAKAIDAAEALAIGAVSEVTPEAEAEAAAIALAEKIAKNPVSGMRKMKALFAGDEDLVGRTARENIELMIWQRAGSVIPAGGIRSQSPSS